jgi:hypothetical protein
MGSARRRPGGPAPIAWVGVAVALAVGCVTAEPLPSAGPSGSPPDGSPSSSSATTDELFTPATSAMPIPDSEGPPTVPLRSITIVCESWGSEPPSATIDCEDAVTAALAALGATRAAVVRRLDFGYGEWCAAASTCLPRRSDIGWVVARTATLETLRVRVALDAATGLQAWPPVEGPRVIVPSFRTPPVDAPDLGEGTPRELAEREAFPFCGSEDVGLTEAFNTAARQCFLDGVRAGSPVELISRMTSTEGGGQLLDVYRFTGEGAIFRYLLRDGQWTVSACGISPITTIAVFVLAGGCDQRPL